MYVGTGTYDGAILLKYLKNTLDFGLHCLTLTLMLITTNYCLS